MIPVVRSVPVRAWLAALCGLALLHTVLYPVFYAESFSTPAIALYALPVSFAIALVAARIRRSESMERHGWTVLLVALCATAIFDTSWSITGRLQGQTPSYPNLWFDIPYLLSYCVYITAGGLLTSALWWRADRRWMFDALALLVMTAGMLWHFVIPSAEGTGSLTEKLLANAYLTLDLFFVAVVLMAWYGGQLTASRFVITAAALLLAAGDIAFYFFPMAFDSSWTAGLWLIAIAAALGNGHTIRLRVPRLVLSGAVPYLFVACLAAITVIEMPGGGASDLLAAGAVALALVVLRQVVSLREALRVQREETAFREALLAAQSDLGLALVILQGPRVIYANRAAEELAGRSLKQLRALPTLEEIAYEEERSLWGAWLADPDQAEDTRIVRGDGRVADVEVVGRRLPGPDGRILLVARDVTERRQSEQAVAQAQKLEGLGALAGGVAHDFNNLLSTILGHVGLLRMGELDDEARESVTSIEAAARRGAELTRRLLDFARPGDPSFAVEDMGGCIEETLALARSGMPVNVRLAFEHPGVSAPVRANRGLLVQALLNLVLNARDAVGHEGEIHVRLIRGDRSVRVEVEDNGPGIDPESQKRIFEPFYSTKAAGAGTGLGLAISQRAIREHRGTLEVRSAPGNTVFVVSLPLAVVSLAS